MFIEPEEPGDPFKVSDADTMLNYIAPNAKKPDQVVVFSKVGCSFCAKAKQLLSDNGFEYIDVPLEHKIRGKVLGAVSGNMTAPQVFINGKLIGGAEALDLAPGAQRDLRPHHRVGDRDVEERLTAIGRRAARLLDRLEQVDLHRLQQREEQPEQRDAEERDDSDREVPEQRQHDDERQGQHGLVEGEERRHDLLALDRCQQRDQWRDTARLADGVLVGYD